MYGRTPRRQAITSLGGFPGGWAVAVGCCGGDAGVLGTIIIVVVITCQREEEASQTSAATKPAQGGRVHRGVPTAIREGRGLWDQVPLAAPTLRTTLPLYSS